MELKSSQPSFKVDLLDKVDKMVGIGIELKVSSVLFESILFEWFHFRKVDTIRKGTALWKQVALHSSSSKIGEKKANGGKSNLKRSVGRRYTATLRLPLTCPELEVKWCEFVNFGNFG